MPDRSEFDLIDSLRQRTAAHRQIPLGIGDDCAAIQPTPGEQLLVTTDMLMDGRHFLVDQVAPQRIGRKALAVNLSDIAAMAGRPIAAFVSWALPRQGGRELAESIFEGMLDLAEEFQIEIAGGDTNSWDGPLVINVTLVGETVGGASVTRRGAKAGDWIFVTGPLGGSIHARQFTFTPRIAVARSLVEAVKVNAMLDLSDGIASDLRHILRESGVGATLEADAIPVHEDVNKGLPESERLRCALCDGEDFELLLTTSPEAGQTLLRNPPAGASLFRIGTIDAAPGCRIRSREGVSDLPEGGWNHGFD